MKVWFDILVEKVGGHGVSFGEPANIFGGLAKYSSSQLPGISPSYFLLYQRA